MEWNSIVVGRYLINIDKNTNSNENYEDKSIYNFKSTVAQLTNLDKNTSFIISKGNIV